MVRPEQRPQQRRELADTTLVDERTEVEDDAGAALDLLEQERCRPLEITVQDALDAARRIDGDALELVAEPVGQVAVRDDLAPGGLVHRRAIA